MNKILKFTTFFTTLLIVTAILGQGCAKKKSDSDQKDTEQSSSRKRADGLIKGVISKADDIYNFFIPSVCADEDQIRLACSSRCDSGVCAKLVFYNLQGEPFDVCETNVIEVNNEQLYEFQYDSSKLPTGVYKVFVDLGEDEGVKSSIFVITEEQLDNEIDVDSSTTLVADSKKDALLKEIKLNGRVNKELFDYKHKNITRQKLRNLLVQLDVIGDGPNQFGSISELFRFSRGNFITFFKENRELFFKLLMSEEANEDDLVELQNLIKDILTHSAQVSLQASLDAPDLLEVGVHNVLIGLKPEFQTMIERNNTYIDFRINLWMSLDEKPDCFREGQRLFFRKNSDLQKRNLSSSTPYSVEVCLVLSSFNDGVLIRKRAISPAVNFVTKAETAETAETPAPPSPTAIPTPDSTLAPTPEGSPNFTPITTPVPTTSPNASEVQNLLASATLEQSGMRISWTHEIPGSGTSYFFAAVLATGDEAAPEYCRESSIHKRVSSALSGNGSYTFSTYRGDLGGSSYPYRRGYLYSFRVCLVDTGTTPWTYSKGVTTQIFYPRQTLEEVTWGNITASENGSKLEFDAQVQNEARAIAVFRKGRDDFPAPYCVQEEGDISVTGFDIIKATNLDFNSDYSIRLCSQYASGVVETSPGLTFNGKTKDLTSYTENISWYLLNEDLNTSNHVSVDTGTRKYFRPTGSAWPIAMLPNQPLYFRGGNQLSSSPTTSGFCSILPQVIPNDTFPLRDHLYEIIGATQVTGGSMLSLESLTESYASAPSVKKKIAITCISSPGSGTMTYIYFIDLFNQMGSSGFFDTYK